MIRSVLTLSALFGLLPTAQAKPDACDVNGAFGLSEPIVDADAVVQGTNRANLVGRSVVNIDLNGDGFEDLVIGAPGANENGVRSGQTLVHYGPLTSSTGTLDVNDADAVFHGPSARLEAGYSMANAGDLDGDGIDDLVIGSNTVARSDHPNGVVWVVYGGNHLGVFNLDILAGAIIEGNSPSGFGQIVAGVGDVDDDGSPDFVIGAPIDDSAGNDAGAAFLFSGPPIGTLDSTAATVTFTGRVDGSRLGNAIGPAGDVDGDGVADLLLGAPRESSTGDRNGTTYLMSGGPSLTGSVSVSTASAILHGDNRARSGSAVTAAGDIDGDGYGDILIGSPLWGSSKRGAVDLVLGGPALFGELNLTDVFEARVRGEDAYDNMGIAISAGHDLDGDGKLDFIFGASRADGPSAAQTGGAWVMTEDLSGEMTVSASFGARYAQNRYANAGFAVAMFNDLNEDGIGDFVVGAFQANIDGGSYRGGQVGVYWGGLDEFDEENWYLDSDGDLWGDGAPTLACMPPANSVLADGDCNDSNPAIHPFAPETDCGDPVDYNCDGSVGNTDADGDGVDACEGDCDDANILVSPNADELCGDKLDNNCDNLIDDGTSIDALPWSVDADGDGDGNSVFAVMACEDPGVFVGDVVNTGGDCNDLDPTINQYALEVCDGVDNNCVDGPDEASALDALTWFADADIDGFGALADIQRACAQPPGFVGNADDCDDADPDVRPGATELCDYKDNDCNSMFYQGGPVSFADAHSRFGGADDEALGRAITAITDWNGDGRDEIAMGAPNGSGIVGFGGTVYIRNGTIEGGDRDLDATYTNGRTDWDARIQGNRNNSFFGNDIASGDVNGDGVADLLIGAPGQPRPNLAQGAVFLFYGPIIGDLTQDDADAWFSGIDSGDGLGESVDIADLDGDGFADMIIGAPDEDGLTDRLGAAHIIYGSAAPYISGKIDTVAAATFRGVETRSDFGWAVAAIGDVDGDGQQDVAVGAARQGGLEFGAAHLIYGTGARFAGELPTDVILDGPGATDRAGTSLDGLGDATGDGIDDFIVGTGASGNMAWLIAGSAVRPTSGSIEDAASTTIEGLLRQRLGNSVAAAGDVNADGFADILLSASDDDVVADNAGASVLLYGGDALPAVVTTQQIESQGRVDQGTTFPTYSASSLGYVEGAIFYGEEANEQAGRFVAGDGDFNGDGFRDMLFGNPKSDSDNGEVKVVYGGGYGVDKTGAITAGWNATLTVDGDKSDWTPETTLSTTSPGTNAVVSWDDDYVYIGSDASDVGSGGPSHFMVVYLGNGDAIGDDLGRLFNTQHPGLPFKADHYLTWRSDNAYNSWDVWNGASFDRTTSWLGTNGSQWQENNSNSVVEFAIPRAALGNPETLDINIVWVFEGNGSETTFHGVPGNAFTNGYDPDPTEYFKLYFGESAAPSSYGSLPTGGGISTVADDYDTWYVDADLDGQADDTPITFESCPMHVPIAFIGDTPQRTALDNAGAATDCDDTDPTTYVGADDPVGDGIDQDCDGADGDASGGSNTPPYFTETDLFEPFATGDDIPLVYYADDIDGDTVTVTFAWYLNNVLDPTVTGDTYPSANTVKGDMVYVEATGDDGMATTTVTSNIATVVNTPPTADTCAIAPGTPGNGSDLTASATGSDVDGDTLTWTYEWTVEGVVDASVTGDTYHSANTTIGDTIVVRCTANDGDDDSAQLTSSPVDVVNTPPTAPTVDVTDNAWEVDNLLCAITTDSTDADGDAFSYTVSWTADGSPFLGDKTTTHETNDTIPAYAVEPGITYACSVSAFDGTASGPTGTDSVTPLDAPDRNPYFASGSAFNCAILDTDEPFCWGSNTYGQLGRGHTNALGDTFNEMQGAPAFSLSSTATPVQIATGRYHACAILSDDSLKCWGRNDKGQLGYGDTATRGNSAGQMGDSLATVDLGTGRIPARVESFNETTCVVTTIGELLCWGSGGSGVSGSNTTANIGIVGGQMGDALVPVDLGTGRHVVDLTMGFEHACALLDNGDVKCWGDAAFGNLGLGGVTDHGNGLGAMGDALPAVDLGGDKVVDLDAGARYTCAGFANGGLKCWGRNNRGQLGQESTESLGDESGEMGTDLPYVDLGTGRTLASVTAGGEQVCAQLDNDDVKCWGFNDSGQIGVGNDSSETIGDTADEMGDDLLAIRTHPSRKVTAVESGFFHSCVITECGDVQCFGWNPQGSLGYNDSFNRGTNDRSMGDALPVVPMPNGAQLKGATADPADCTAWEHSITVDGDLSDWLPEETFSTSSPGGQFYVTWDDELIYFATVHPDVTSGGFEHNFIAYFGNGTDDPADPAYEGFTEGRDINTQAPGFAIWAQTYVHWRADDSFIGAANADWVGFPPFIPLAPAWTEYPNYTPPIGPLPGYAYQENEAQNTVEFSIPRDELYIYEDQHPVLFIQSQWAYEGAGFESSYNAVPSDSFVEGTYDPDFSTMLRLELDHPDGPGVATIEMSLIP